MTVMSAVSDRVFSEIKRLCYAGLDAETLSPRVVERLRRAVPFDGHAVVTIDPLTGLATDFLFSEEMRRTPASLSRTSTSRTTCSTTAGWRVTGSRR